MYCTRCGAENEDDAKFCEQCGEKFQNTVDNIMPAAFSDEDADKYIPEKEERGHTERKENTGSCREAAAPAGTISGPNENQKGRLYGELAISLWPAAQGG